MFCNSCGVKYAKQRALNIESKLISGTHRHLVFIISDILWPLFLEDRKRLNFMFKAISNTLLSWYKEKYKSKNLTPDFVLNLHTFGRDDKWNVHIHCLLSEFALGNNGEKKMDFIPFDMLRKHFQKLLLNLLENNIGKTKFRSIKNKIYSKYDNGFYVRAKFLIETLKLLDIMDSMLLENTNYMMLVKRLLIKLNFLFIILLLNGVIYLLPLLILTL